MFSGASWREGDGPWKPVGAIGPLNNAVYGDGTGLLQGIGQQAIGIGSPVGYSPPYPGELQQIGIGQMQQHWYEQQCAQQQAEYNRVVDQREQQRQFAQMLQRHNDEHLRMAQLQQSQQRPHPYFCQCEDCSAKSQLLEDVAATKSKSKQHRCERWTDCHAKGDVTHDATTMFLMTVLSVVGFSWFYYWTRFATSPDTIPLASSAFVAFVGLCVGGLFGDLFHHACRWVAEAVRPYIGELIGAVALMRDVGIKTIDKIMVSPLTAVAKWYVSREPKRRETKFKMLVPSDLEAACLGIKLTRWDKFKRLFQ